LAPASDVLLIGLLQYLLHLSMVFSLQSLAELTKHQPSALQFVEERAYLIGLLPDILLLAGGGIKFNLYEVRVRGKCWMMLRALIRL
jgi:hypothetical protein